MASKKKETRTFVVLPEIIDYATAMATRINAAYSALTGGHATVGDKPAARTA